MNVRTRPNTIFAVWIGGAVLPALAYRVGPDHFVSEVWDTLSNLQLFLVELADRLESASFDFVRAVAIGLFLVFVVLSLMAIRRGLRGRTALVIVSLVFATILGWKPATASRSGWLLAFLLALVGAASMTGRLLRSDDPRPRG